MRKPTLLLSFLFLILACKEPEPRRPVQQKSGSFFSESIERSKQILAKEEALFQTIIEKDTTRQYFENPNGFWFFYERTAGDSNRTPDTDDEILITYNFMSLKGDTIYSFDDVGVQQIKVDKSRLFAGVRNAIKILKEGEKATFLFPSSQVYGYKGDNNKIGPNVPIKSSLELIKILTPIDSLNTNKNIK